MSKKELEKKIEGMVKELQKHSDAVVIMVGRRTWKRKRGTTVISRSSGDWMYRYTMVKTSALQWDKELWHGD